MQKPKTWSHDQHIQYELALDTISSLEAILRRQAYVTKDVMKKDVMKTRARELAQEEYNFNGFDDMLVKKVIDTYSPLIREYYTMGTTEEEVAAKGLPDKFFTTKVTYRYNIKG